MVKMGKVIPMSSVGIINARKHPITFKLCDDDARKIEFEFKKLNIFSLLAPYKPINNSVHPYMLIKWRGNLSLIIPPSKPPKPNPHMKTETIIVTESISTPIVANNKRCQQS